MRHDLPRISARVLSLRLHALESRGLVVRHALDKFTAVGRIRADRARPRAAARDRYPRYGRPEADGRVGKSAPPRPERHPGNKKPAIARRLRGFLLRQARVSRRSSR
ncbi:hypothetical protein [Ralstonia pseudosolanacearum]|uniref:hypothetical protein n=1 Tax=Ralstonia pseudosolanacearum TaxID=1310165 RepID=UPI003D075399